MLYLLDLQGGVVNKEAPQAVIRDETSLLGKMASSLPLKNNEWKPLLNSKQ